MNEEITRILKDILFQLHVISSQNYTAMSMTAGEDPISEKTREYGIKGLQQEKAWMEGFVKERSET